MTAPPFLLGGALLFWGWQTGMWLMAATLAIGLESARWVSWRVPFSDRDFTRIADVSTLLLLVLAAYQFILGRFPQSLFLIFQWLPLLLFPLMGAQAYSSDGQIRLGALHFTPLLTLLLAVRDGQAAQAGIRMDYLYFASCLFGAASANTQTPWFYGLASLLVAWGLWGIRPRRYSFAVWCALMLPAIGIGYAGHIGLSRLQSQVQEAATEWLADYFNTDSDPYQSSTQIGKLGRLKLSDRVVLRVRSAAGQRPPLLLRDAVYNTYASGAWLARPAQFQSLTPAPDGSGLALAAAAAPFDAVEISLYAKREKAVLALPPGTFRVSRLAASRFEITPLGGVKVSGVPELALYRAQFSPAVSWEAAPVPGDLQIPANLTKPLERIAAQLRFDERSQQEALAAISGFFANNFKYTLFLGNAETGPRQIDEFLLRSRVGHCEYFATATVLLLRKAGIPARYATGYAVQEFSPLEDRYLVRARHAHAWALAYIDGHWREIDTTPAVWAKFEEKRESVLQPLLDLGSWLAFRFSLWRMNGVQAPDLRLLMAPAILLAAMLAWHLGKMRQVAKRQTSEVSASLETRAPPGADSPFYRVIGRLERGRTRRAERETLPQWINRTLPDDEARRQLHEMLGLHYRYRFDPMGLGEAEKTRLAALAKTWLQQNDLNQK